MASGSRFQSSKRSLKLFVCWRDTGTMQDSGATSSRRSWMSIAVTSLLSRCVRVHQASWRMARHSATTHHSELRGIVENADNALRVFIGDAERCTAP